MRRAVRFHLPLFVLSYFGLLAHSGFFGSGTTGEMREVVSVAFSSAARTTGSAPAIPVATAQEHSAARQSVTPVPVPVAIKQDYDTESSGGLEAVDYSNPDRALRSLEKMALRADDARTRLAAVTSMVQLATGGDPDGRIREALRLSSTDLDPRVATLAREGNAALSARDAPQAAEPPYPSADLALTGVGSFAADGTGVNRYREQLALERTAQQSPDADTRIVAVTSLAQIARTADPGGRVHEALRIAATDMDSGVAAAARRAQAEVAAWEAARQPTL